MKTLFCLLAVAVVLAGLLSSCSVPLEAGVNPMPAYFYWRCAWSHEYLVASNEGDQAQMAAALELLAWWPQTVFYKDHVVEQPGAGWQEMVIEPAQRGDSTRMRAMDSADCHLYRRTQAAQG